MAIYSFAAPLLVPSRSVVLSYALIFIASCLFYPAGATYYGLIGDRLGRQKSCVYSTLGLAVATGLIGLIPSSFFAGGGWMALLALICAQYFFSGGEYHGSIVFSLEHGKSSGLMSSLSCLFAVLGLVAASGLVALSSGGPWVRLCFLVGGLGGGVSYLLKNQCQETPAFAALSQEPLKPLGWSDWSKIGTVVAVLAFFMTSYTFIFIFLPLVHPGHPFNTATALVVYGGALVASGLCADRIGDQRVMVAGMALFSVLIVPLCSFCEDLFLLQLVLTICASLVIGPIHSWMLRQFEVKHRCRGIFISSAIATALFGGSAVPICLMIFEKTHALALCSVYPLAIALGSWLCFALHKKRVEVAA